MLSVTLYVFIGIIAIQLCYYLFIFGQFSFTRNRPAKKNEIVPVSVIVCAKNEAENIKKHLPLLLNQDHPQYEVVLIDDASNDNTRDIFEEFEQSHNNIKLVKVENIEAFWGNKKFALTLGIKAARYEHLLFIDPECYPAGRKWIREMCTHFSKRKTIVVGYSTYEKKKNSILNKLIRFETLLSALQMFGWVKSGKPFTANGKNLAYKKEEFFKVRGFNDHMKIRSGEDELFINQAATGTNTAVCSSRESFTYGKSKTSYKNWWQQKRRHLSTQRHYKTSNRFQIAVFNLSQTLFLFLGIFLAAIQYEWEIVLGLIAGRYIFTGLTIGYAANKLGEKDVLYLFPFLEIAWILTRLNITITNLFSKPVHWK